MTRQPTENNAHDPAQYGDHIASDYDEWASLPESETSASVASLIELAAAGPVLELGVGTGRVARRLATCGLETHGIEASSAMVAKLSSLPGGENVRVIRGDFSHFELGSQTYSLVYVVFSTFFALTTQEAQVRCFESVARVLQPGGLFVLEASVPDLAAYSRGQFVATRVLSPRTVRLDAAIHDPVQQRVSATHILLSEGEPVRMHPFETRYAWPAELDLMARIARLSLKERWSNWEKSQFDYSSIRHISIYSQ